jgi:membrane protease YdiL (CAAX protease family)
MPDIVAEPFALLPFALLLLAVFGLWLGRALWMILLAAAVGAAYWTGAMNGLGGVWLALLAVLCVAYANARGTAVRLLLGVSVFLLTLAMALLLLPGFPRTTLTAAVPLTPGALPYGIGLGFAKVAPAILLLGLINTRRVISWSELGAVLARAAPIWLITVGAVIALTVGLGFTKFEPKWNSLFLLFAVTNLFFTCLSEEAFFRGFVQHELTQAGARRKQAFMAPLAIALSAVLFGLIHFAGGWKYVLAGVVAGLGYALVYHRTQRIEAAMAAHFGLNAVHFLLFTYPALAPT